MKRMQKGFTLIELMIVVAIIGILAAVAIPQYQDYTVKAKLSKSASYAAPFKTAIALFMQENGSAATLPADGWSSLGMGSPSYTPEVTNITIGAGTGNITITLAAIKTGIDGTTVQFAPVQGNTAVTWNVTCTSTEAVLRNFYKCQ